MMLWDHCAATTPEWLAVLCKTRISSVLHRFQIGVRCSKTKMTSSVGCFHPLTTEKLFFKPLEAGSGRGLFECTFQWFCFLRSGYAKNKTKNEKRILFLSLRIMFFCRCEAKRWRQKEWICWKSARFLLKCVRRSPISRLTASKQRQLWITGYANSSKCLWAEVWRLRVTWVVK